MERGPNEPAPDWLKWYFIIGGSVFCIAVVTMGVIFAVFGRGNMYEYDEDHDEDTYHPALDIIVELYSEDDTMVITNYGRSIRWDDYRVKLDNDFLYDHEGHPDKYNTEIFFCNKAIAPWTEYSVYIYEAYDYELIWSSTVYSSYGNGQ
ncbi:MAG: hypothetical protein R6V01_10160 [Thermoplasmatota archaeon]